MHLPHAAGVRRRSSDRQRRRNKGPGEQQDQQQSGCQAMHISGRGSHTAYKEWQLEDTLHFLTFSTGARKATVWDRVRQRVLGDSACRLDLAAESSARI